MNKIITIGREFGSGGRELGKRLAEDLGIAYYDSEIISAIAKRSDLAESYVNQVVEKRIVAYYPITVASTMVAMPGDTLYSVNRSIYAAQTDILREMAEKSDCVIVGRCADHILADHHPLRIFVYSSMESKLARCRAKGGEDEDLSDKELTKKIRAVDKSRAQYYRFYTGQDWGDRQNYDLCVNTTGIEPKTLAALITELVKAIPDEEKK